MKTEHKAETNLADEIIAAIIQGVCTIAAAGLAVQAARASLSAWRKEAPGRRRLELAEQCLGSAYGVHTQIISYSSSITHFMLDELKLNVGMSDEERRKRKQSFNDSGTRVQQELVALRAITRITSVYFGNDLGEAHWLMYLYFLHWQGILLRFQGLCDETFEKTAAKQALYTSITPAFGSKDHECETEICVAPIKLYEKVLKPHLGVLASRTR